ncbi:hypothetical protein SDC9_48838 [bioreactor metagenome]|uniref:Uncharacterized protein n=1 Tax=bioreactor metagenome TaxID=1076179 RepID=A0A644WG58_9ZZZZ
MKIGNGTSSTSSRLDPDTPVGPIEQTIPYSHIPDACSRLTADDSPSVGAFNSASLDEDIGGRHVGGNPIGAAAALQCNTIITNIHKALLDGHKTT